MLCHDVTNQNGSIVKEVLIHKTLCRYETTLCFFIFRQLYSLMTKKGCLIQAFRGPKQIKLGSLHQTSSICLFFQSILRLHSLFSFKVVDGLCDPRDLEAHKVLIIS